MKATYIGLPHARRAQVLELSLKTGLSMSSILRDAIEEVLDRDYYSTTAATEAAREQTTGSPLSEMTIKKIQREVAASIAGIQSKQTRRPRRTA